jgi:hypothetical protein
VVVLWRTSEIYYNYANNSTPFWKEYAPKCLFNIRLYVYDNLPPEFTHDIERHFTNQTLLQHGNWDDLHTEHTFVQLFRSSPCRVNDTSRADIFVVPYMHLSDCMLSSAIHGGYGPHCRQMHSSKMSRLFAYLQSLPNFTTHLNRHLFITMYHDFMMKAEMTKLPLRIMSSPQEKYKPGYIVVPLANLQPRFQPSNLISYNDEWWIRPRKYAFSAFYGGMNANMNPQQPRRFRKYFFDTLSKREKTTMNETLGGMPYATNSRKANVLNAYEAYENSIFCPILPGDMPFARRIFDAMFHGCIPVFMRWTQHNSSTFSWFTPDLRYEARYNYPFSKMLYSDAPYNMEDGETIDYESFAIQADGNPADEQNYNPMFDVMEMMIQKHRDKVQEHQLLLKAQVVRFTYGMGKDAYTYDDAFSRVMKLLETYVDSAIDHVTLP